MRTCVRACVYVGYTKSCGVERKGQRTRYTVKRHSIKGERERERERVRERGGREGRVREIYR